MYLTLGAWCTGLTRSQNEPVAMGMTSDSAMLAHSSAMRSSTASLKKLA